MWPDPERSVWCGRRAEAENGDAGDGSEGCWRLSFSGRRCNNTRGCRASEHRSLQELGDARILVFFSSGLYCLSHSKKNVTENYINAPISLSRLCLTCPPPPPGPEHLLPARQDGRGIDSALSHRAAQVSRGSVFSTYVQGITAPSQVLVRLNMIIVSNDF